jgi:hypothetical protein
LLLGGGGAGRGLPRVSIAGKMLAMNRHTFAAARKKLEVHLEPTGDIRGAEKGTPRHSV